MKKFGKGAALFCAGAIAAAALAGCGTGSGETGGTGKDKGNDGAEVTAEKSMGRYLEQEILVPEISDQPDYYAPPFLGRQGDGKLVLADRNLGNYISGDRGESWEAADCPWSALKEDHYIGDIALSPDGATALVCSFYGEEEDAEEEEDRYYYVAPEGTITEIPFQGGEDEAIIEFEFDRQGGLYGCGSEVYRFDLEAGTTGKLFEVEGLVDSVCFTERYMVVFTTRNKVILYDLEKEMIVEDDRMLQDFVTENLGSSGTGAEWGHDIIAASGEKEDIVYLAFRGGLYRHVIGGTVMEQIIDGSITTFGDPGTELLGMEVLPDNEFLVLYTGRKLCRYTYDPNVPAVPERQLNVYSLVENDSLRQAVSLFQKEHQDVYVRYEIGMSGHDGITKEDAIRNLNTEIMAGEGPDIMLLDGLPQDSYEEKGVLADVSKEVESMTGEEALFPNIVEACRKGGKIYALPIRVQVPMAAGRAEYVEKIEDLESLADAAEQIRGENPEGAVLGLTSAEELLRVLSLTCSKAWTDEAGEVDEEALAEFLAAAKRIWQAEISGLDEEALENSEAYGGGISWDHGMEYATVSKRAVSIAMGEQLMAVGKVYKVDFDYDALTSVAAKEEDFGFRFWNGQAENVLIPDGMAGILANSAEDELALSFYRFLFGRKLQDMDLAGGLPVNMASFDTFAANPYVDPQGFMDENVAGSVVVSNDLGERYFLELIWPDGEEFGRLKEMVGRMSVVNGGGTAVEEAVLAVGQEMLKSDMEPQEAVREIVRRSAIYLAE